MATKEFEQYLMQVGKSGQAQQGLNAIQGAGNIATGIKGFYDAKKAKTLKLYDTYIDKGYEPLIDENGTKRKINAEEFKRMSMGDELPNLTFEKPIESTNVIQYDPTKPGSIPSNIPKGTQLIPIKEEVQPNKPASVSIESATPEQIATARALMRGDILTENLGLRDRGFITSLAVALADKEGVDFKSYQGNVRKGFAQQSAYGKIGNMALSLNTGIGHAGDALSAYENVKNSDVKFLNTPINLLKKETNDPNIIALELNLNALSGELATIFKGSAGTDQEIKHWMTVLTPDLTPVQAQAALKKVAELLTSRQNAIVYQQGNVMNQPVGERNLISPKSQKTMDRLGGEQGTVTKDPLGLFK